MRRLSNSEKDEGGGGEEGFQRFGSHITLKYTEAVRSRVWSKLIFATLCVILRSRVLIISVGACYMRGARSRRLCGWWGRRERWRAGGAEGMNESYVLDG